MKIPKLLGCLFCGQQPTISSHKVPNCGEPYMVAGLVCACGVSKMRVVDSDDKALQSWFAEARAHPKLKSWYDICAVVGALAMADEWNTRAPVANYP